jgi:hypothetical protein
MHFSEWFIRRPVGTSLLAIAITLAGAICFFLLPVSPLPQVEYPTVSVSAGLPMGPEGPMVHIGACVASVITYAQCSEFRDFFAVVGRFSLFYNCTKCTTFHLSLLQFLHTHTQTNTHTHNQH